MDGGEVVGDYLIREDFMGSGDFSSRIAGRRLALRPAAAVPGLATAQLSGKVRSAASRWRRRDSVRPGGRARADGGRRGEGGSYR